MENQPPIQMSFLEGESNEEEIKEEIKEEKEKEYTFEINNIKYKLILVKDSQNIEFKLYNINNLSIYYYCSKYSFTKIIDIMKLKNDLYNNLKKIIQIIDNAYLYNKISLSFENNDYIKLIIKLSNKKSKEYDSIFILNKKKIKIEEKFEKIINEISLIKQNQKGIMENELKRIENKIIDAKHFIDKIIKDNINLVNILKEKIKNNEELLKQNKNVIDSLKKEINSLNKIINDYTKKIKNDTKDVSKKSNTKVNKIIIKEEEKNKKKEKEKKENNNKIKNNDNKYSITIKEEEDFFIIDNDEHYSKKSNEININNTPKGKNEEKNTKNNIINKNIKEREVENNIIIKKDEYKVEKLFDDEEKTTLFFSLMLIGDTHVGKSWIFDNFFSIPFINTPSICLDSEEVFIKVNDEILSLNIEDIPGQERFQKLSSISKKDLIIFVYSIDNKNSFEIIKQRIKKIKEDCNDNTHFILVGNKMDLNNKRVISKEEGSELAKNEKIDFFIEVSAKTGENIENIFFEAAKILYKNRK